MTHPLRGAAAEAVVLAALFAAAHTQSPLYYSNQNQYLLHGLARAGYGHLSDDWLANTRDPTPLFSWGVAAGYRTFDEASFQAAFFLLLMGYFVAARSLVGALPGVPDRRAFRVRWAALFTAAHAAVLRAASVHLTGVDYPWYLQSGVAGQYLLGPGLQPSAFGVLLLAGLAAFARGRPVLAAALFAGSALVHSTYLLPAGLFTAGLMVAVAAGGRWRTAIVAGTVALLVVAPQLAYTATTFAPSAADRFAEAQRLLAEVRIPHHAVVGRWLDAVAWGQLAWMAVGIALTYRTPLFPVLAVPAAGGVVLTLVQVAVGGPTVALLFPWRVSAVLMPVATAVIIARLVRPAFGTASFVLAGVVLVSLAAAGVVVMATRLGYPSSGDEEGLYAHVRGHAKPGDVYLLPVRIPEVGAGRGSVSTSFTPPPRPKPGSNLIPVDLQRFRLHAGAPVYVDFKSVPYADAEVLEWYRRMLRVQDWYAAADWDAPATRDALRREGVTHVVAPRGREPHAGYLEPVYSDPAYAVFRVR